MKTEQQMTSKRNNDHATFLKCLSETGSPTITKIDLLDLCESNNLSIPYWFINQEENRASRGVYLVPNASSVKSSVRTKSPVAVSAVVENVVPMPAQAPAVRHRINNIMTELEAGDLVPAKYANYVPFGHFNDIKEIISSKQFYPVMITGHSGNGKTMSIEQACACLKRKFVCVSMTQDTDEGDLLGNYVLVDGSMIWRDGPVTVAARAGAVLCIDEIDYGAQNLSCLQRVFEGKPFLLKKKNEVIYPELGFTIFCTGNTKGKVKINVINNTF